MCVFCSIVKGDIPSNKLYEDDMVIAFFDINPTSYGHCLVVPKEHCDSFLDCPTKTLDHVFEVAQKLANVLIGLCFGEGPDVKVTVNSTVVEGLYQGFVNAARDSEYLISFCK